MAYGKSKMRAILIQNSVQKAIDGVDKMLEGMTAAKWEEIDTKTLLAIQLCLSSERLLKNLQPRVYR